MRQKTSVWVVVLVPLFSIMLLAMGCKKSTPPALGPATTAKIAPDELKKERFDWNMQTLVDAYQKAGHSDPKWDAFAISALTEFARVRSNTFDTNEPTGLIIATNVTAAANAGCDDPMVNYLFIRFALAQTNSPKMFSDAFCKTALDMENSSYPSVRKFYSAAAAVDQLFFAYGTNTSAQPIARQIMPLVGRNLAPTIEDKTMPVEEAYEVGKRALYLVSGDKSAYTQAYDCIKTPMFNNWPNDYLTWLLKGDAYVQMAWLARGGGYAPNVSDQGWKAFFSNLTIADEALTNAWNINSNDERTPILMIRVAEGRQKRRDEMELWFSRAMAINPDCYDACEDKLHYLYPQWYGSREDMVEFGRQCVASTNWGGRVPLILSDAHREYWLYLEDPEAKTNYWKLPDVWPDIQSSFNRFFELNPDAVGYYHNYAWFAYQCQQWKTLNELIPKLGPVNYAYFGGKDEFDKMLRLAKQNDGKSDP